MTHEHHFDNVAPYLLAALPARDREAFERHMETCARCRDEVAHLRLAADALPHAVPPIAPPPELKAALMEVVEREASARAPATAPARAPARRERTPWRERLALPRLRPAGLAFGAASVLALGVGLGYGLSGGDGGEGPNARTVTGTLAGIPAGSASVTIPRDGGQAVLRVRGLPDPGPRSTYQVWLSRDGRVTPQSLFAVGRDGRAAAAVPDPVAGADAVMVTREPKGGSPAPTTEPIVTVAL